MNRRQFLHTLNANGMGAIMLPLIGDSAVVEETGIEWNTPKIGIVSVGGIGGSCLPTSGDRVRSLPHLNRTVAVSTCGAELYGINADRKVLVGDTKTLVNPRTAGLLTQSAVPDIAEAVAGLDMVLLVAGMGGATGTGIAPSVAQLLREQGILTLAFAVMPFAGEGGQRKQVAQAGVRELRLHVNALIPFFNNDIDPDAKSVRWQSAAARQAPVAFMEVCRSILNPLCRPGWVNIDFEDLRNTILNQQGDCAFGFGFASGADGAAAAATRAIDHPLLGRGRLQQASAVLMAISAPPHVLMLRDSYNAVRTVRKQLPPNAYVIYGAYSDQTLGNDIAVSILANG